MDPAKSLVFMTGSWVGIPAARTCLRDPMSGLNFLFIHVIKKVFLLHLLREQIYFTKVWLKHSLIIRCT